MLELNQCYNMDCMKGMAQFPDGFFDLAVVDPPYFSGPERRGYYGSKVSKIGVYRDYPVSPVWEIPGRAYFDELRRVAKHYIVWGCNYFSYEFAPGRIVWDKCKKGTSFSDCELAATDLFNTVRLFRFMWNGMLQGKSVAEGHIMQGNKKLNEQRIHPTQKPVALYDWIFQNYAAPGCRVLDTSCYFCPSMKKKEIQALWENNPELFQRAVDMEHNAADRLTSIKGLGRKWSWESYHDEFIEAQELEKAQLTFDDLFPEAPGGCLCGAPCGCYDG